MGGVTSRARARGYLRVTVRQGVRGPLAAKRPYLDLLSVAGDQNHLLICFCVSHGWGGMRGAGGEGDRGEERLESRGHDGGMGEKEWRVSRAA